MTVRGVIGVLLLITAADAHPAWTQESRVSGQVITGRDFAILGGGVLGAAVLSAYDVRVARMFAESSLHRNPKLDVGARRTSAVTETLLMISGASAWAIGRLGHSDGMAEVALHTTESVASGAAFIQVIRGIAGRARPYVLNDSGEVRDSDPYDFDWFHGFRSFSYRSFPSMHAMASFAAATALSEEMRMHRTRYRGALSPLLYLAATASPASRMYLDEHWASDIALGAFLGIFAGHKVVTYTHAYPRNPVDRFLLEPEMNVGLALRGGRLAPVFCVSLPGN